MRRGGAVSDDQLQALMDSCVAHDVALLTPADALWPLQLRAMQDPPALLYLRGAAQVLCTRQVSVVGARRASARGLADTRWLVRDLVAAGLTITSGLALGIDGAAHAEALQNGGLTIAVLACGLDRIYPSQHRRLAHKIVAGHGVLLSEFPPGTPPLPHHFPRRNRIISGLSCGVLVVEAGERSGSMITARLAAEQGREVFAVPGAPRDWRCAGCLRLLSEGALLVRSADDVLAELGVQVPADDKAPARADQTGGSMGFQVSADAHQVLQRLDNQGSSFECVVQDTGLDAARLSAAITELELNGQIARDGMHIVRIC